MEGPGRFLGTRGHGIGPGGGFLCDVDPGGLNEPPPTSPGSRAGRKEPLSLHYARTRQCKVGEPRWVAAVSGPEICARPARIASRINALCGSDMYRINELVRVAKARRKTTAPEDASSFRPWETPDGGCKGKVDLRNRVRKAHRGSTSLVGQSNAVHGDQSTEGKCRVGFTLGALSPTSSGPRRMLQWTSKFPRMLGKSSLGAEVYAHSETAGHMSPLKDLFGPFDGLNLGAAGLEDCGGPLTCLKTKKMIAGKCLARRSLSTQQSLGEGELDNIYLVPGTGHPADGPSRVRSDMAALLRLLESGHVNPGSLRPKRGVAWRELVGNGAHENSVCMRTYRLLACGEGPPKK